MRLVVDSAPLIDRIEELVGMRPSSPLAEELRAAAADAYKRLVAPACELDVTMEKTQESDRAAVEMFAENLRNLLLASPLGEKRVLAIDPGIRTGCKVAMLDATGKFLGNTVIYPMQKPDEAREIIAKIMVRYKPDAVAVGKRHLLLFQADRLFHLVNKVQKCHVGVVVDHAEVGMTFPEA